MLSKPEKREASPRSHPNLTACVEVAAEPEGIGVLRYGQDMKLVLWKETTRIDAVVKCGLRSNLMNSREEYLPAMNDMHAVSDAEASGGGEAFVTGVDCVSPGDDTTDGHSGGVEVIDSGGAAKMVQATVAAMAAKTAVGAVAATRGSWQLRSIAASSQGGLDRKTAELGKACLAMADA